MANGAASPGSTGPSGRSPSRSRSPRRCCSTASAACCARAAPGSPTRSPATRSSTCWSAARCSRSASTSGEPFQSYFSGNTIQICPVGALTVAAYRFRARPFDLVSDAVGVRALRVRLRAAHRPPPRQGHAAAGRRRPGGQRGVELRQGPLRVPLRPAPPTGSPSRWSATRDGELRRRPGPRRWPSRPRAWRARTAGVGVLAGGRLTVEDAYAYAQVRPGGARHQRRRLPGPAALRRGGGLPGRARRRRGRRTPA